MPTCAEVGPGAALCLRLSHRPAPVDITPADTPVDKADHVAGLSIKGGMDHLSP